MDIEFPCIWRNVNLVSQVISWRSDRKWAQTVREANAPTGLKVIPRALSGLEGSQNIFTTQLATQRLTEGEPTWGKKLMPASQLLLERFLPIPTPLLSSDLLPLSPRNKHTCLSLGKDSIFIHLHLVMYLRLYVIFLSRSFKPFL